MGLFRKKQSEPEGEAPDAPDANASFETPGDASAAEGQADAPAPDAASDGLPMDAPARDAEAPPETPLLLDPSVHPPGAAPGPRGPAAEPRNITNDLLLTFATFGFWYLHVAYQLDKAAIRHGGFREDPTSRYSIGGAAFFAGLIFTALSGGLFAAPLFTTLPAWSATVGLALLALGGALLATFAGFSLWIAAGAARKLNILQHWAGQQRLATWQPVASWFIPLAGPYVSLYILEAGFNAYWDAAPETMRRWASGVREREALATAPGIVDEAEDGKPRRRGQPVSTIGLGPGAKSDPRNPIFRKRLVCPTCKMLNYVNPARDGPTHVTCQGCGTSGDLELRLQIETRIV